MLSSDKVLSKPGGTKVVKTNGGGSIVCVRTEVGRDKIKTVRESMGLLTGHPNMLPILKDVDHQEGNEVCEIVTSYFPNSVLSLHAYYLNTKSSLIPEILLKTICFQLLKFLGFCKLKAVKLGKVNPKRLMFCSQELKLHPTIGLLSPFQTSSDAWQRDDELAYHSPEQLLKLIDPKCGVLWEGEGYPSDVWSVGILLCKLNSMSAAPAVTTGDLADRYMMILNELGVDSLWNQDDLLILQDWQSKSAKLKLSSICTKLLAKLIETCSNTKQTSHATNSYKQLASCCLRIKPDSRIQPIQGMLHTYFDLLTCEKEVVINGTDIRPFLMDFTPLEAACYEQEVNLMRTCKKPTKKVK